jgi:hypothetical protein
MQTSLLNVPAQWHTKLGGSEFRIMRMNDASAFSLALNNPEAMVEYLLPRLKESIIFRCDVENFIVIHLNTRLRPIGFEIISQGTIDTLLVRPAEVFKGAIVANSAAIALAHNLCAATHKLCYVKCRLMCSDRLTALMLIWSRAQARGMAVLSRTDVVFGSMWISPRGGCHA